MEQHFESSLEAMTLTGQHQPSVPDATDVDEIDKVCSIE